MKKILILILVLIPQTVFGISPNDLHAVQYDTVFYSEEDSNANTGACSTLPPGPISLYLLVQFGFQPLSILLVVI